MFSKLRRRSQPVKSRETRIDAFDVVDIKECDDFPSSIGVIKNISRRGARITVFNAHHLPNNFEIWFSGSGTGARAKIRWRDKNDVGVRFRKPIDPDTLAETCRLIDKSAPAAP